MTKIDETVLEGLGRVPTGVLADVLCEMGLLGQVISSAIAAIGDHQSFIGRAICVAGQSEDKAKSSTLPLPTMFDVDALVAPGCVVVVDAGGHRIGATIGGLVALAFKRAGAEAFLTDGGVRDREEITAMGLPCLASFVTPRSAKGVWSVTAVNETISLPGQDTQTVSIDPGDLVRGDADGIVIIPSELAVDVLRDALKVEAAEGDISRAIEQRQDRREAYRRHDRFGHIRRREERAR